MLLVDDNVDFADGIALLLQTSGYAVEVVHSGPEALLVAAEFRPDVVVLDIGMPGMDGYDLVRAIRALPDLRAQKVPAVAVTAYARSEDQRRALAEGFQLHLSKPIEPATFALAVARLSRGEIATPSA